MPSKPTSATRGSCARTPSKPPQLRGKSSYQAPKRARSRSASTVRGGPVVKSRRAGGRSSASSRGGGGRGGDPLAVDTVDPRRGLLQQERAFGHLAGEVLFAGGAALAADLVV